MFGVRFSFVATRSGLTRARLFDLKDYKLKQEVLAFTKLHARTVDETFYSRTIDYNMLVNDTATVIQVPFNTFEKIRTKLNKYELNELQPDAYDNNSSFDTASNINEPSDDAESNTGTNKQKPSLKDMNLIDKLKILTNSSIYAIATQSIIVNEGSQRASAGVTGIFYDYATFVQRFFSITDQKFGSYSSDSSKMFRCGHLDDSIDCLLIDNNGFIVVSEQLEYIGQHIKAYNAQILNRLLEAGVYREINITDYQAVCQRSVEKQITSGSSFRLIPLGPFKLMHLLAQNAIQSLKTVWVLLGSLSGFELVGSNLQQAPQTKQAQLQQNLAFLSYQNKTYLRPCERILTLYDAIPMAKNATSPSNNIEIFTDECGCNVWFAYEPVPFTNLIMLIVDDAKSSDSCSNCERASQNIQIEIKHPNEDKVCSTLERESKIFRKRLESCYSHHPNEEQIKLCGYAGRCNPLDSIVTIICSLVISFYCANRLIMIPRD